VPVESYSGEEDVDEDMKTYLTPAQLRCSHCGANLESCFDFDEIEIPHELIEDAPAATKPTKSYSAWFTDESYEPVHFTETAKPGQDCKTYYDVYKFVK
jgi:hypothetical protein